MSEIPENTTRKKFLLWGAGILGSASIAKVLTDINKKEDEKETSETVKMLTQDGTLVEINTKLMTQCGGKITNAELQSWVKTKPKT